MNDALPSRGSARRTPRSPLRRTVAGVVATALAASVVTLAQFAFSNDSAVAAPARVHVQDDGTRMVDFNDSWTFYLATRTPTVQDAASLTLADAGDYTTAQIIDPAFDDSGWRTVSVPHDFSIEGDKTSASNNSQGYMQGGLGFYRKTFSVPESVHASGKRVAIDFEGVYQNSVVYLNGQLVGTYPSGYTGFSYDLTDLLNYGDDASNTLVVKVQNPSPSGRWYTGSGIVRPVHLVVTSPVRFVRNGVSLTTPQLEQTATADGSADLNVSASVFSDATNGVLYTRTSVIDANGNVAAVSDGEPVETNPSTLTQLTQSVHVPNVKLWYPWNLGDPYLYTVRTQLFYQGNGTDQNALVDTIDTEFGFRWYRVDNGSPTDPTAGGLYVNGKYTKINGVDLHHDSGALGAASFKDGFERQWDVLKSMGVNAYRTSHNPPSKQAIEVASEKGIIVAEEAYDGWGSSKATYDFGRFFLQNVPTDWAGLRPNGLLAPPQPGVNYEGAQYLWSDWVIQEMVERDKNEASVFLWSIGNEVRGVGTRPAWYDPAKYDALEDGVAQYNEYTEAVRLAEAVKDVDPTRPIIQGGDQERSVPALTSTYGRINRYLDGFGLNYNTATSVDGLVDRFHDTTFFFESESSSQTSSRGVYLDPSLRNTGVNQTPGKRGGSNYDNDFASWTMSNEYGLKKDRDRKAFLGQFVWSGFDYIGEPTPYSVYPVGVSSFGAIDTAGFPKDSYYLFRSQWVTSDIEPQVHVLPGNWNQWKAGEPVEVWVNANVPSVELFLNGQSLGRKTFDVKETAYGKKYYETSERIADDKTWPTPNGNTGGYASNGATVVSASGDSAIPAGTNYGKLHLTWDVPFAAGVLEAKAYSSSESTTPVATDVVATAGSPYTVELKTNKNVLKADGQSLAYIEATVVDEAGNEVPDADNLLEFDVTGGAIVGVDNGRQESNEPYKWGGVERNTHSQRSAYAGKALAIVQSNKGQTGQVQFVVRSAGLEPAVITLAATDDGTGAAPAQVHLSPTLVNVEDVTLAVPSGPTPTLPRDVRVTYNDSTVGTYSVVRRATWAALDPDDFTAPGELTLTGTVDGLDQPVKAYVSVVATTGPGEIAVNPALGNNNQTYSFDGLPADSPLRAGALATATFTGATNAYPNNAVNGDASQAWTNQYSRSASVLLPAFSQSRPYEQFELFWDGYRTFGQVQLSFTQNTANAVPSDFDVQYWDGLGWQDVSGLAVSPQTATDTPTTLTFDSVLADRVRIGLTNATPYSATGNVRVTAASVSGLLTTGAVVKAGLRQVVDEAEALDEDAYTPATWEVLTAAVEAATAVLADEDATADEVASATQAVRDAIAALVLADQGSDVDQELQVVIPETTTEPGEFIWAIDGSNGLVDLGTAEFKGDHYAAVGTINPVRVTDTRIDGPSWSISGRVGDFVSDASSFEGQYLGWTPSVTENTLGAESGPVVGSGFDGGPGLSESSRLGGSADGHPLGSALLGADLTLKAPVAVGDGTYRAHLTLTALS